MSDTWGTVFQLERDRATGSDPESLRREIEQLKDAYEIQMRNLDTAEAEVERLRAIEARAKLVIAEWPRTGRVSEPMADQLEALRELLTDEQSAKPTETER